MEAAVVGNFCDVEKTRRFFLHRACRNKVLERHVATLMEQAEAQFEATEAVIFKIWRNYKPAALVLMLAFSSAEGSTCESMGCKSHVSETTSPRVSVGTTSV